MTETESLAVARYLEHRSVTHCPPRTCWAPMRLTRPAPYQPLGWAPRDPIGQLAQRLH